MCVQFQLLTLAGALAAAAVAVCMWILAASATYLVDFYSFRPPTRCASLPPCQKHCVAVCHGACNHLLGIIGCVWLLCMCGTYII